MKSCLSVGLLYNSQPVGIGLWWASGCDFVGGNEVKAQSQLCDSNKAMSDKEYTRHIRFFIHHEDTKFVFFLRALRALRGERKIRNSGMLFHGNGLNT
jgi:hypothetical protein